MALARNLKNNNFSLGSNRFGKFFGKHKKKIIIGLIIFSVLMGAYGILTLSHLAPGSDEKEDLVYQTGDQPLPEKITIYINAEGGLNMRSEPNTTSQILKIIPDKTQLTAEEIQGEWYKVVYDGKTGWVNEKYITKSSTEAVKPTAGWQAYQNTSFGYSLNYPTDWVKMDYGANQASSLESYVGFGMQLSDEIDPNIAPPIVVKVTKDAKTVVDANYAKKTSVVSSKATISGVAATKYVYTASSGVQMTTYVVSGNGYTYILEESGGYADELTKLVGTFKIN